MIVFDRDAHVLIDSGSDRSYVSISFASFSDRNLSPVEEEIVVHTLLGSSIEEQEYFNGQSVVEKRSNGGNDMGSRASDEESIPVSICRIWRRAFR
ncbi:Uncharacterized protein TCM_008506 [Theobroma cacao]|uniref:Uncharacterized protein n=1 Tax=Theobroma cacao TaxID=3641 RepID=A0A061E3Y8_THECC|nr:Uncharacterized protein TCM_008506 [Theobroma cacao]